MSNSDPQQKIFFKTVGLDDDLFNFFILLKESLLFSLAFAARANHKHFVVSKEEREHE